MTKTTIGFQSEAELARCYSHLIQEAINNLNLTVSTRHEVSAPGGIPDLVIFNEYEDTLQYVITVEFKLSNWRRAIHQAFRHRNYGNEAYVVLDQAKSRAAIRNLELFRQANVGLVTVNAEEELRTWYSPKPGLPFSKEFSQMVACSLLSPRQPMAPDLPFIRSVRGGAALSQLKVFWSSPSLKTCVA